MPPKKALSGKKRGPAPKPLDEKAEQLTIRLAPKLKLGLELLQRAQRGRSLSQVVEWALSRGLGAIEVGPSKQPLSIVLDKIWGSPRGHSTEWQRITALSRHAPELLDFQENSLKDFVINSEEFTWLNSNIKSFYAEVEKMPQSEIRIAKSKEYDDLRRRTEYSLNALIEATWHRIKERAIARDNSGLSLAGMSLADCSDVDYVTTIGLIRDVEALEELLNQMSIPLWKTTRG
jgi:hypothetical protein